MIQVAKTTSQFKFDDSQLARTRQLIDEIKTRLQVEAKLVDVESKFHDEIPVDQPAASGNISQEIADYFSGADTSRYASAID